MGAKSFSFLGNRERFCLCPPTRDNEVRVNGGGPADLALSALPPHADLLLLVGQVLPAGEVERLHGLARRPEEVLRAAGGREVLEVAVVLCHLYVFHKCVSSVIYKCVGEDVTLICHERGIIIVAPTGVEPSCMARLAQFPSRTSTYTAGCQTRGKWTTCSDRQEAKFGLESGSPQVKASFQKMGNSCFLHRVEQSIAC